MIFSAPGHYIELFTSFKILCHGKILACEVTVCCVSGCGCVILLQQMCHQLLVGRREKRNQRIFGAQYCHKSAVYSL